MKICVLICFLLSISLINNVSAQDTIWFLSGERLITSSYNIKIEDGMLNYFNKRNKERIWKEINIIIWRLVNERKL